MSQGPSGLPGGGAAGGADAGPEQVEGTHALAPECVEQPQTQAPTIATSKVAMSEPAFQNLVVLTMNTLR
jgi:hypothetical protein